VTTPAAGGTATTVARRPANYGDSPALDALYDKCKAGNYKACDDLYVEADNGTAYQRFGDTCGNRNSPAGFCVDIYGGGGGGGSGGNAELDALASSCEAGNMAACDELYTKSPSGSNYEQYALTCGGRNEPSMGLCTEIWPG
jgi:hypothetical protein